MITAKYIQAIALFADMDPVILTEAFEFKEEWHLLPAFLNCTRYRISNYGKIKSLINTKETILNPKPLWNGYIYTTLYDDNKNQLPYLLHQLMAITFLQNPNDLPLVDHINRNKTCNIITNLRWSSYHDNNMNRKKVSRLKVKKAVLQYDLDHNFIKEWESSSDITAHFKMCRKNINAAILHEYRCKGFYWKYKELENLEDEIWKEIEFNDNEIEVSSMGRIKNKYGYNYGSLSNTGYMRTTINDKEIYVHRLVCMAFNPVKGMENLLVDHINRIITDNRAINLRFTTAKGNGRNTKANRAVNIYDAKTGDFIKRYDTMVEASEELNSSYTSLCNTCRGNQKIFKGPNGKIYTCKYADI